MKPEPGGSTAVLAGAWNKGIFTPPWIAKQVFAEDGEIPVELAIAFGADERLLRFPTKKVEFRVSDARIIVNPTDLEEESLRAVNASVEAVLRVLCHTPISAIGFNFAFSTEEPEEALRQALAAPDAEHLQEQNLTIRETKSVKTLTGVGVSGDHILNLSLRREHLTNSYAMEFNYHYPRDILKDNGKDALLPLRDHAFDVLRAYGEAPDTGSE